MIRRLNNKINNSASGFTLLEILIALAIFAVISVITAIGLRSVINTHRHVEKVDQRLRELVTATTIMRRDFSQMINRPVLDTSGVALPALLISSKTEIQFTHAGFTNPMGMLRRSSLQRVAYSFSGHKIYRTTWRVLDRAPDTKSYSKVLLDHVKNMHLSYVNNQGQIVEVWSNNDGHDNKGMPKAIIIKITLQKMGRISLVIPIRGRGNVIQT